MDKEILNDKINKCFNLCELVSDSTKPNIYGRLYNQIYGSSDNYVHFYPRTLVVQLTSGCNLRCKHCFFFENQEKYNIQKDLSKEKIIEQIKYFVEEVNILSCTLTGGEIFTSSVLFEVIRYLKKHNVSLKLITNGTLIDEDIAKRLGELLNPKFDIIQISLDGAIKETNDKTRGNGAFDKVLDGIKLLVQNNCNIELGFTINAFNVNEIADLYLLAKKNGVKKINYGRFTQEYESQSFLKPNIEDIFINVAKLSDVYDGIVKLRLPCITVPDYLRFEIGRKLMDKKLKQDNLPVMNLKCKPHDEQVTMFANGNISLCYDCTVKDVFIGNISESSFDEIWNNRFKSHIFQARMLSEHSCKNCKYVSICKAGCPYRAYVNYGLTKMPGYDCSYYKTLQG